MILLSRKIRKHKLNIDLYNINATSGQQNKNKHQIKLIKHILCVGFRYQLKYLMKFKCNEKIAEYKLYF
jgi:hypothetical protein